MTELQVVPIELAEANAFIAAMHRHHAPVVGHRFSIGVVDSTGLLRGVCVVGRPVARLAGTPRDVAEVTRLATDGAPNACSMLYGAAARAARALGFRRIQTYTLPSEGCADTATPCPCPAFTAWDLAAHPEPRPCLTCLDVEWLLLSGERWEQVCARLRYSHDGLRRHLGRCGRDDLLARIKGAAA